jgi:hypothetical protein
MPSKNGPIVAANVGQDELAGGVGKDGIELRSRANQRRHGCRNPKPREQSHERARTRGQDFGCPRDGSDAWNSVLRVYEGRTFCNPFTLRNTVSNNKNDFDLFREMSRGCLYRGGESEENFLKGYVGGAMVIIPLILLAFAVEMLLKWLF